MVHVPCITRRKIFVKGGLWACWFSSSILRPLSWALSHRLEDMTSTPPPEYIQLPTSQPMSSIPLNGGESRSDEVDQTRIISVLVPAKSLWTPCFCSKLHQTAPNKLYTQSTCISEQDRVCGKLSYFEAIIFFLNLCFEPKSKKLFFSSKTMCIGEKYLKNCVG